MLTLKIDRKFLLLMPAIIAAAAANLLAGMKPATLILLFLGILLYVSLVESGRKFPGHGADCMQTGEALSALFIALYAQRFLTSNFHAIFFIVLAAMLLFEFMFYFMISPGRSEILFYGAALGAAMFLAAAYMSQKGFLALDSISAACTGFALRYTLHPVFIIVLAVLSPVFLFLTVKLGPEITLYSMGENYYGPGHDWLHTGILLTVLRSILVTGAVLFLGMFCFGGLYLVSEGKRTGNIAVYCTVVLIIEILAFLTIQYPGVFFALFSFLLSYILYFIHNKKSESLYAGYQRA